VLLKRQCKDAYGNINNGSFNSLLEKKISRVIIKYVRKYSKS
jgi:hypothetical protein